MKKSTLLNRLTKARLVCAVCGLKFGVNVVGVGVTPVFHYGKCDVCLKRNTPVSDISDFGNLYKGKKDLIKLIQAEDRAKNKEKIQKVREKAKAPDHKKLRTELKRITHKIVRLQGDKCYCCNKPLPNIKDRCAGHYWSDGGYSGTRYDFDNLRICCVSCNKFKSGNLAEYGYRLKKELGDDNFERLYMNAHFVKRWTKEERKAILSELESRTENVH